MRRGQFAALLALAGWLVESLGFSSPVSCGIAATQRWARNLRGGDDVPLLFVQQTLAERASERAQRERGKTIAHCRGAGLLLLPLLLYTLSLSVGSLFALLFAPVGPTGLAPERRLKGSRRRLIVALASVVGSNLASASGTERGELAPPPQTSSASK